MTELEVLSQILEKITNIETVLITLNNSIVQFFVLCVIVLVIYMLYSVINNFISY